jgi:hypothetical protein
MLASRFVAFPGFVLICVMASIILPFVVSLTQDLGQKRTQFSLGHLLFFVAIVAVMLGIAVTFWRLL